VSGRCFAKHGSNFACQVGSLSHRPRRTHAHLTVRLACEKSPGQKPLPAQHARCICLNGRASVTPAEELTTMHHLGIARPRMQPCEAAIGLCLVPKLGTRLADVFSCFPPLNDLNFSIHVETPRAPAAADNDATSVRPFDIPSLGLHAIRRRLGQ
jgi:hypothetical protein